MSLLKVNKVSPQSGTDFTLGDSGDTFTVPSGVTLTVAGTFTQTGAQTFDGGVDIDNFNINGTTITLSSGDMTLDVAGDIVLDADGGDVFVKDGGTTFGSLTNTSGNLIIKSGTTTAATFSGANVTLAGTVDSGAITSTGIVTGTAFTAGSAVLAEAELELLDGLTAGTAIASKVVTTDSDIDTTGQRNLTISGELDAATGDFSGAVDIAGQLTVADGSAGAPAISNTGDANTGLLFSAADTLAFSAGGTSQFTMADGLIAPVTDNDVDLGTNSLQFKNVHVNGTTFTDAIGFGTVVMTLPTADGNADQILTTDGSGTLAFVDNSGGTSWVAVKTGAYTASAGEGVFANTSSSAWTLTLPAGSIGDEISFIDYAGTFDSNALTIAANGSEKILGSTDDLTVTVERAANTLVFTDGTQGWLLKSK